MKNKNDHWLETDVTKKLKKAAVERQVIVTWYKPEEKLPPDDRDVIVTFSGSTRECMYIHAFGIAKCCSECEYEKPAWGIFGFSVGESMKMHVEAWADLDPYGMGEEK